MSKIAFVISFLLLAFIIACSQSAKEASIPKVAEPATTTIPAVTDSPIDTINNQITDIAAEEDDLSTDNLEGLDLTLEDIENI